MKGETSDHMLIPRSLVAFKMKGETLITCPTNLVGSIEDEGGNLGSHAHPSSLILLNMRSEGGRPLDLGPPPPIWIGRTSALHFGLDARGGPSIESERGAPFIFDWMDERCRPLDPGYLPLFGIERKL